MNMEEQAKIRGPLGSSIRYAGEPAPFSFSCPAFSIFMFHFRLLFHQSLAISSSSSNPHRPSNDIAAPLAKRLDDARGDVELVGIVDQPHPGAERRGERGELLVWRVNARVHERRGLVDDQVRGGEPFDEAGIKRGIAAEA